MKTPREWAKKARDHVGGNHSGSVGGRCGAAEYSMYPGPMSSMERQRLRDEIARDVLKFSAEGLSEVAYSACHEDVVRASIKGAATLAYRIADAMLAARDEKKP
jgi:hypothetical protein